MKREAGGVVRRHDLDWLRVLAILSVFVYHSTRFFDYEDWSMKNATIYSWVTPAATYISLWMMPLIFIVSGASIYYATRKGGALRFAWDKVLRLLVPLVVGVFTFSIGQVYIERLSHGDFDGTLFQFLPHYFEGVYFPGEPGNFAFHGLHLWYLMVLFLFTIVLMPLFWGLKTRLGGRVLSGVGGLFALPGALVLFAVPTLVLQNLTDAGMLGGDFGIGGWRIAQYVWFFLAGYLIVSHEKLQARVVGARWVCLALTVVVIVLSFVVPGGLDEHRDAYVWPVLLTMLGFAMHRLTFRNRFLDHAGEAVLPFYILHQNVLIYLGFFVMPLALPDPVKWVLVSLASFATIIAVYEFVIRRFTPVRVLFGMKPLRRRKTTSAEESRLAVAG